MKKVLAISPGLYYYKQVLERAQNILEKCEAFAPNEFSKKFILARWSSG